MKRRLTVSIIPTGKSWRDVFDMTCPECGGEPKLLVSEDIPDKEMVALLRCKSCTLGASGDWTWLLCPEDKAKYLPQILDRMIYGHGAPDMELICGCGARIRKDDKRYRGLSSRAFELASGWRLGPGTATCPNCRTKEPAP